MINKSQHIDIRLMNDKSLAINSMGVKILKTIDEYIYSNNENNCNISYLHLYYDNFCIEDVEVAFRYSPDSNLFIFMDKSIKDIREVLIRTPNSKIQSDYFQNLESIINYIIINQKQEII